MRYRAPQLRYEQQLLKPDSGAARPVEEQRYLQGGRVHFTEEAGRGSRAAASGEDWREAHHAEQTAGGLLGCAGGRSVQAGSLSLLSKTKPRGRRSASAACPLFFGRLRMAVAAVGPVLQHVRAQAQDGLRF